VQHYCAGFDWYYPSFWRKLIGTLFYPSSTFGGVWCGFESDTLTWVWVSLLSNKYPWGSNPATNHAPPTIIQIRQNNGHFSNMVNTRRKPVKCFICKEKLCNENRLEAHYQQYHPISMNEGLLPNRIVRGSPLIAVMIHVIQASTHDYHSEVDTIGH